MSLLVAGGLLQELLQRGDSDPALRDGLRRALEALGPEERRLFTLRFLYQWSSARIGQSLGLSPNGVDARVARLRKKLKHLLAQQGLGWDRKEDTK